MSRKPYRTSTTRLRVPALTGVSGTFDGPFELHGFLGFLYHPSFPSCHAAPCHSMPCHALALPRLWCFWRLPALTGAVATLPVLGIFSGCCCCCCCGLGDVAPSSIGVLYVLLSCYNTLCFAALCCATLFCAAPCCATPCFVTPGCATPCFATPCCAVLRSASPRHVSCVPFCSPFRRFGL